MSFNSKQVTYSVACFFISTFLLANGLFAQEDPASTLKRFLSCWESGDATVFESLLHEEATFSYPGGRINKAEFVELFTRYQTEKEKIRIYFSDTNITDGDHLITTYQFVATDRTTQKRFAVGTGVNCLMKDGKIFLLKEYFDLSVAMQQYAGKLPLDEGTVSPWPYSIWLRPETVD